MAEKESKNRKIISPKGNTTAMLLSCIGIAVLLWLANRLTHEYDGYLKAHIIYNNIPQDYVLGGGTTKDVTLHVKTKGFYLLLNKIKSDNIGLEINAAMLPFGKEFVASQYLKNIIAASLNKEYTLIGVQPDTLNYIFDKKFSKSVPIKFNYQLDFESQYGLAENILIEPSQVVISGPKKQIIDIKLLETEVIIFKKLKEDLTGSAKVIVPGIINASLDTSFIKYTIKVEKYTEQEIDVPVRLINVPVKNNVVIYPKKVKVTCLVSLNNFEKVKPDLFEVVADFSNIVSTEDKQVLISLKRQPTFVKNVNWSPKRVEYIINK